MHLRFAADQAARLGLRVDVTLGSGWPFGGPHIPVTQAAGELRVETAAIPPGAESVAVPTIGAGEKLLRVFLVPGATNAMRLPEAHAITADSRRTLDNRNSRAEAREQRCSSSQAAPEWW